MTREQTRRSVFVVDPSVPVGILGREVSRGKAAVVALEWTDETSMAIAVADVTVRAR